MIDLALLKKDPAAVAASLARRGFELDVELWHKLDQARKLATLAFEDIQGRRKKNSAMIAQAGATNAGAEPLRAQGEALREEAETARTALAASAKELLDFAMGIPNIPMAEVPDGADETQNVVIKQHGQPTAMDFIAKPHDELGELHDGLDFAAGAALAGSRFVVAKGPIARLHRALIQFMLDTHVDRHGYLEVQTPYLVKAEALVGTGQLPKFGDDLFHIERDGLYLIPTAEVPVTNLLREMNPDEAALPIAMVCHTPCFRREAGAAGKDAHGLIRQHQFEKIELVRACAPAEAEAQLELLLRDAEAILQLLGLPYRAVLLCAGDLGFSSQKTIDLEVWIPAQQAWREISSVSLFGDFQARRMEAKFKAAGGGRQYLSTLNGSGLAAGRTLVAILENFQDYEGGIAIPEVLRPYMGGMERLAPKRKQPEPTPRRPFRQG